MSDQTADESGAREPPTWSDTAMSRIEEEMEVEVSSRAASPRRRRLGSIAAGRRKEETAAQVDMADQAESSRRRRILGGVSAHRRQTAKEVEYRE
jgi:hypothetical protein